MTGCFKSGCDRKSRYSRSSTYSTYSTFAPEALTTLAMRS